MKHFETSNNFFVRNTVKVIPRSTSFSTELSNRNRRQQQSVRLRPDEFVQKEVFRTNIYKGIGGATQDLWEFPAKGKSVKPRLNIKGKESEESILWLASTNEHLRVNNFYSNKTVEKKWKTMYHHLRIVAKLLPIESEGNALKVTFEKFLGYLEDVLGVLFQQYDHNLKKIQQYGLNITGLKRKKLVKPDDSQPNRQAVGLSNSQSCQLIAPDKPNPIKMDRLYMRINQLEFDNKKMILITEKLHKELMNKNTLLTQRSEECHKLQTQFNEMNEERASYQYKLSKLKEELEVAHIVKEQNLADKINYILGWKL